MTRKLGDLRGILKRRTSAAAIHAVPPEPPVITIDGPDEPGGCILFASMHDRDGERRPMPVTSIPGVSAGQAGELLRWLEHRVRIASPFEYDFELSIEFRQAMPPGRFEVLSRQILSMIDRPGPWQCEQAWLRQVAGDIIGDLKGDGRDDESPKGGVTPEQMRQKTKSTAEARPRILRKASWFEDVLPIKQHAIREFAKNRDNGIYTERRGGALLIDVTEFADKRSKEERDDIYNELDYDKLLKEKARDSTQ